MLYIVATPIGNLQDITLRALEVLRDVDFVLAEDTRVTKKLFARHDITTPLKSYHHHSSEKKVAEIVAWLREGKRLALVTDAGTPGVSDPGNELIAEVLKSGIETDITPIPGPSAVTAAASVSGFPMNSFLFLGFPPAKKKRKKYFQNVVQSDTPVVFYESSHRIVKSLKELRDEITDNQLSATNYKLFVARELTKMHETLYRGSIDSVIEQVENDSTKGEFVVVVNRIRN